MPLFASVNWLGWKISADTPTGRSCPLLFSTVSRMVDDKDAAYGLVQGVFLSL